MKSKFTIKAFFPLLFGISLVLIILYGIFSQTTDSKNAIPGPLLVFLSFTAAWLLMGEVRTKMIKVEFENDYFSCRHFMGLGRLRIVQFQDVEGYKTSILSSKGGHYEYLYIMANGKKIAKISQFYHRNYNELKMFISQKLTDQGFERFSFLDEIKESFSYD